MLSNITWTQFLLFICGITILYYAAVFLKFKSGKVSGLLKRKNSEPPTTESNIEEDIQDELAPENYYRFQPQAIQEDDAYSDDVDTEFKAASDLSQQIRNFISEAAEKRFPLSLIQQTLRTYIKSAPIASAPAYKTAVRNLIQTEATKHELTLSAEMIGALWD